MTFWNAGESLIFLYFYDIKHSIQTKFKMLERVYIDSYSISKTQEKLDMNTRRKIPPEEVGNGFDE